MFQGVYVPIFNFIKQFQEGFAPYVPKLLDIPPPRVDRMLADLCSRTSDDVGYPNMHKNWNFRFFGQISSPSRPFSWIFCQNLDFQKFDLYPYNFELSCSHHFLTDNGQFYHFSKGKSVLRCEIWNFGSTIILRYKFC